MITAGIFAEQEHIELLQGQLMTMAPQSRQHAARTSGLNYLFGERLFRHSPPPAVVSVQSAVPLSEVDRPEPDIALLSTEAALDDTRDLVDPMTEVYLLVEVSLSTVSYDLNRKVPRYAALGVPEVWVVDLAKMQLLVFRTPVQGRYQEVQSLSAPDQVGVLRLPELGSFPVEALLRYAR